jgi:hypothetical protein
MGWEEYTKCPSSHQLNADEEVGKCEIALTDKSPRVPIPQNVAGVISILLLGMCLGSLQFKFIFRCSSNLSCIPHLRLINGGERSVDSQPALLDIELRLLADMGICIGVFVAYADTSLVLVSSGTIGSEFQDFENAGWIITSYTLAMCATQSLVTP